MKEFTTEVYPDLLEKLSQKEKYLTKTGLKTNHVIIEDSVVFVKTDRSAPDYKEIPIELFEKTWDLLSARNRVTQEELSESYNIKRSAFMLIAFDLLDYVKYNANDNSLILITA